MEGEHIRAANMFEYEQATRSARQTPLEGYILYPDGDVENGGAGPCLAVIATDRNGEVVASGHFSNPFIPINDPQLQKSYENFNSMNHELAETLRSKAVVVYLGGQADIPNRERYDIKTIYESMGARVVDLRNDEYISQSLVYKKDTREILVYEE